MKLIKYVCTHCGRRFEAEEKEILECPGCFWSTSVKKEEDWAEAKSETVSPSPKTSAGPRFSFRIPPHLVFLFLLVLGTGAALVFVVPKIKGVFAKRPASEIKVKPPKSQPPAGSPLERLTQEEKNVLQRRLQVSPDRPLDEEEKKILEARAVFKTGFSEKLPSQTWTLEGFKEMITQGERSYQVPLPRSYKNKLEELFQTKYVPASEAFKNGELIKARDLWVESLAFPQYSKDIQRHRGVALTMLRPFITDTLSKIGAINNSSVEKTVREKEEEVSGAYAKLGGMIEKKSWQEALEQIKVLKNLIEAFSQPEKMAESQAAPYPAGIQGVDQDIQATLFELLKVPPPPVADLEPIRRDVVLKEKLIQTFLPGPLQAVQVKYDEALDAIGQERWRDAETPLQAVDTPPSYYKDAQEKIRILKKLADEELDSPPQNS